MKLIHKTTLHYLLSIGSFFVIVIGVAYAVPRLLTGKSYHSKSAIHRNFYVAIQPEPIRWENYSNQPLFQPEKEVKLSKNGVNFKIIPGNNGYEVTAIHSDQYTISIAQYSVKNGQAIPKYFYQITLSHLYLILFLIPVLFHFQRKLLKKLFKRELPLIQ